MMYRRLLQLAVASVLFAYSDALRPAETYEEVRKDGKKAMPPAPPAEKVDSPKDNVDASPEAPEDKVDEGRVEEDEEREDDIGGGSPETQDELEALGKNAPVEGSDQVPGDHNTTFIRLRVKDCRGRWMDDSDPSKLKAVVEVTPPNKPDDDLCKNEAFKERSSATFDDMKDDPNWELQNDTEACAGNGDLHVYTNKVSHIVLFLSEKDGSGKTTDLQAKVSTKQQNKTKQEGTCFGAPKCKIGDRILVRGLASEDEFEIMERDSFKAQFVECAGDRKDELESLLGDARRTVPIATIALLACLLLNGLF